VKPMTRPYHLMFVLLLAVGLSACAHGPSAEAMLPDVKLPIRTTSYGTLAVDQTTGGKETNPMWVSSIDNETFNDALVETLKYSDLFDSVFAAGTGGDFRLTSEIVSQEIKSGVDMSATLMVHYELFQSGADESIWAENVFSQYEAAFEESYYGVKRAQKANEGAVRDNLKQLTETLATFLQSRQ